MTDPDTVSADYTLRPSELAATLALLVEARQPTILWGAPGCAKSALAQQTAAGAARRYVDVRALLLDPVDLRGIPWRDADGRTRWAPPAFLPPAGDPGRWLINLEELPSAVPMVQAALYQLVLDRKVGEYELPDGASLIACGNRESDRGVVHRMPTPLASRFVHLEIRVDAEDWLAWGAANGIAPEVLFYIQMRPDLLHAFDPQAKEKAFCCPRTWEIVSNVVNRRGNLDPTVERALFRGTVGEGRGGGVLGLPQGMARAAPSPGRARRSRERRRAGQCERADRPLRLALPHGRRHHAGLDRHLRPAPAPRGRRVPGRLLHPARSRPSALARLHPLGRRAHAMTEETMYWRLIHRHPGDEPSREYIVRAASLDAARRKLAAFLNVPVWTLR